MRTFLLLIVLYLIPIVFSHVIPPKRNEKHSLITRGMALSVLKNAVRNDKINCVICSAIVQGTTSSGHNNDLETKKKACITLDIDQPYICDGMIDAFAREAYFVLDRVIFTPDEIGGIFVDNCGISVNPVKVLWNLTNPGRKPAVKPWPVVKNPKKTQRVLHLSDIHIDREYAEGSEADCELCAYSDLEYIPSRPSPGLKLISINSIYCSHHNFYMYINQTDPDETLTWLISELLDSEAKGEKVHIISHIPAGDDSFLMGWSHNFYEIVNRFENTIAAQFYGHTHNDHFQVYYEDSDPNGRPTHFNFITPSITTNAYKNPAYRIYTIDGGYLGASYTVLDAETYTTDITQANMEDEEPMWFLEYSTRTLRSLKTAVRNDKINCVVCSTIVQGINQLLADEEEDEKIDEFLKKACVTLDIEPENICDGIVDVYASELYFVLDRLVFTPDELCGIFVNDCGTPINPLKVMWNFTIPGGKPPVKPWPIVKPKRTQRVLHFSDIHIDRGYTEGSEVDCKDSLCCRNYPSEDASPIKRPAGKWGSLGNCDLPFGTFEAAMRHISQTHKDIDYILITGDLEAHDEWEYSQEKTKADFANITQVLNNYFPTTPVYQSTGNHDTVPADAMAAHNMEEYDTRGPAWLYNIFADNWGQWISPEAVKTVHYRGSFADYPPLTPGLKLISINTIYCSHHNFYIYINQTDPDETLSWLVSELLQSEVKGEKVHLFSHIPPGDKACLMGWSHNFYEIVNRFENTIAGQFFAHTHNDHFEVFYEDSNPNGRPTHFNFITPSMTTLSSKNPAYRIYTIDGGYEGASYTVLDAETYSTDINEANTNGHEPEWFLEYSAKDAYNLPDLSPASWSNLIDRLAVDDDLFQKFYNYFSRTSHNLDCVNDPVCRQGNICPLRVAKSYDENLFCP
ncbi:hypothetical protein PRIPAC_78673 [Pristionchus pacificus]|uniref:Sphingomyelin phosphodiesterase n=1 Tax=Pristionchus pacificus TaxID=54126 RepID=A0A2A6C2C4_PRIPA|nr:hypothetical protein PRIPAC_78673 [Pristionchus pacificus]|eukprot:PDM72247.1 Calcineurin-like phosphoesterase [Pristionchus pacificus]